MLKEFELFIPCVHMCNVSWELIIYKLVANKGLE
jgi:hypothetical protein